MTRLGLSALAPMYMYMTIIFQHLFIRKRLVNRSQILYGASLRRGNINLYNVLGLMTKMAAVSVYGKNLQLSSSLESKVL